MEIKSNVTRFLFDNHGVRGEIAQIYEPCKDLLKNHNYEPSIKKLMLELIASSVLVADLMKKDDEVLIHIKGGKGNKAIDYAVVNINKDFSFYGSCIKREGNNYENATFKDLIGEGGVLIISIRSANNNMWQGVVPLEHDNISLSLEDYFNKSAQLPTKIFIYTDEEKECACGVMLQVVAAIENNKESLDHLSILTATLTQDEIINLDTHKILSLLFAEEDTRVFEPHAVSFKCICSKERFENVLMSLQQQDLKDLIDDGKATMICHHCNSQYTFNKDELLQILRKISQ